MDIVGIMPLHIRTCPLCGMELLEQQRCVRIDLGVIRKGSFRYLRPLVLTMHEECAFEYFSDLRTIASIRRSGRITKKVSKGN